MGFIEAFLALCFLVFFHELGHFCAAKLFGVRVEVFSIGFGQKILKKTFGNTEYALSLIPLGGYVKLKGQNDLDPRMRDDAPDSYTSKSALAKIIILCAGAAFNFLLAFILYLVVAFSGIKVLLPVIGTIQQGSPAQNAQLLPGDEILQINTIPIKSWEDLSQTISAYNLAKSDSNPESTQSSLSQQPALHFHIKRGESILIIPITPIMQTTHNVFGETIQKPMIGINAKGDVGIAHLSMKETFVWALDEVIKSTKLIYQSVQKLVLGVIPIEQIGGVVGIVDVMANIAPSGFIAFLLLVALISVNLGVINLLPIPALDGGQILFVLYEAIMRKPLNERIMYGLSLLGWGLLLTLMALGIYNDIMRILARSTL